MVANLTRRGTSHDQFCVRFPYTYFSPYVVFLRQLSTAGTDRNKHRLTKTGGVDVARLIQTGRDRLTDTHTCTRLLKAWAVDARTALLRKLLPV